jgi:hypothetical protein
MTMRNVLLAAVVLLATACGAYHFPSGAHSSTGSVTGSVLVVPCAPVQAAGSTCAGLPAANVEVDFVDGSTTVAATTDSKGQFAIDLVAGTYKVTFKAPMRILQGPNPVDVQAGATLVADYILDSGMRIPVQPEPPLPPVPQQ